MTTKHIAIERNLLDIGDVEEALSAFFKRKTSIGDVECTLAHCVPLDTETPYGENSMVSPIFARSASRRQR